MISDKFRKFLNSTSESSMSLREAKRICERAGYTVTESDSLNESPKVYYIKLTHRGRETIWEGTIEYFVNKVFGYTLNCGHGWNRKINPKPTTIKALVNALNKSADACNNWSDLYEVSSKEEFDNCDNSNPMKI